MNLAVSDQFSARIRRNEPMSKHTSWRVGGPADLFFTPHDRADLAAFLRQLPPDSRSCGSAWAATCWCAMEGSVAW